MIRKKHLKKHLKKHWQNHPLKNHQELLKQRNDTPVKTKRHIIRNVIVVVFAVLVIGGGGIIGMKWGMKQGLSVFIDKNNPIAASDIIVMTFNVQNIFDGIDNHQEYSEYKPPQWNETDYQKRLVSVGKAIQALDFKPQLIAFQEVEHKGVVEDIQQYYIPYLTHLAYTDNIYSATENVLLSAYEIISLNTHTIDSQIEKGTRHILDVRVNIQAQETQIIVVHLKSKRASAHTSSDTIRGFQYDLIERVIDDSIPTMILGDFNDDTPLVHLSDDALIEFKLESHTGIQGTYNYKNNWNMLDHILIDERFDAILQNEHLLVFDISPFLNKRGYPNRFDKRRKNFSAVSDHLPLVFYADFME